MKTLIAILTLLALCGLAFAEESIHYRQIFCLDGWESVHIQTLDGTWWDVPQNCGSTKTDFENQIAIFTDEAWDGRKFVHKDGEQWQYMVIHQKENPFSVFAIDPGIHPDFERYEERRIIFPTLKVAIDYVNAHKLKGVEIFKVQRVEIEKHKQTIKKEVEILVDEQYTLKGEKPKWKK